MAPIAAHLNAGHSGGDSVAIGKLVTWCFTPSQPLRLYQGDCDRYHLIPRPG